MILKELPFVTGGLPQHRVNKKHFEKAGFLTEDFHVKQFVFVREHYA